MGFLTRLQMAFARFMVGRNGPDNIGHHAMRACIVILLANLFLRSPLLSLLSDALLIYAVWRMLSRNLARRQAENGRYVVFFEKASREVKQFFLRLKGMKTYRYFRCPSCKNRLRLKRGSGVKQITCPVCRHRFEQKA